MSEPPGLYESLDPPIRPHSLTIPSPPFSTVSATGLLPQLTLDSSLGTVQSLVAIVCILTLALGASIYMHWRAYQHEQRRLAEHAEPVRSNTQPPAADDQQDPAEQQEIAASIPEGPPPSYSSGGRADAQRAESLLRLEEDGDALELSGRRRASLGS